MDLPYLIQLQQLIKQLRDLEQGCPWLREQTLASVSQLTIEESYELADSIDKKEMSEVADELSDLLFHVLLYAQIGEESKEFDLETLAQKAIEKQLRRKPFFLDHKNATAAEALAQWEANKRKERLTHSVSSLLDNISHKMPNIMRAIKLQNQAASIGFDWSEPDEIFLKLQEEINELKSALTFNQGQDQIAEEIGDLIFTCINLARRLNVDPDLALRHANTKFETRFRSMETESKTQGKSLLNMSLEEMDKLWESIKRKKT